MYLIVAISSSEEQSQFLQQIFYTQSCLGIEVINDQSFQLYFPIHDKNEIIQELNQQKRFFDFSYELNEVEDKNWNRIWEEDYQPIIIDQYCSIIAPFHEPIKDTEHQIIINPEMAFGTGHHDTTQLMIDLMRDIDLTNQNVLDLGSGTGVLAILASKENAKSVDAIDIDPQAVKIMTQNFSQNSVYNVTPLLGQINSIEKTFNVILANITKNVILTERQSINKRLVSEGFFICSGFLKTDQLEVIESFEKIGFTSVITKNKNNWSSVLFKKH